MSGDLRAGVENSSGDPRVIFVLGATLSAAFAYLALWLTEFAGVATVTWRGVAALALALLALTIVVTNE